MRVEPEPASPAGLTLVSATAFEPSQPQPQLSVVSGSERNNVVMAIQPKDQNLPLT